MRKINPRWLIGLLVAIFFCVALIIRVVLPWDRILSDEWIKLSSVDAYYYMRLVDNLVHNFPHITAFDPFFIYPGGNAVGSLSFFYWLLSGITWVIDLGSPSQHTINVVSVFFPPVLAALTVIPVYFIGKALFNRWAGVLAMALVAIIPGEFLGRTILGFSDTPAVEMLFTTATMAFLILAIKTADERQLTFKHFKELDRAIITRPLILSVLAGIFLGLYLISWLGGMLFVFIIALYLIVEFIINHLRHKSSVHLGIVGFILFLVALIIFLPLSPYGDLSAAMVTALFIPLVLTGVSLLISGRGLKAAYYPLALVIIGVIFIGIFYTIAPNTFGAMLDKFRYVFFPGGAMATTNMEMQPFLFPQGSFSLDVAWGNLNTSFFFSLFALIIILFRIIFKRGNVPEVLLLFFVWSLVTLAAMLSQRRFAYYFAVNVALLTGYFSVVAYYLVRYVVDFLRGRDTDYMSRRVFELEGFGELVSPPDEPPEGQEKRKGKRQKRKAGSRTAIVPVSIGIWLVLAIFLLAFFPNIGFLGSATALGEDSDISFGEAWWHTCLVGLAADTASAVRFAPTDAWQNSLTWMERNTPEPFGDPDAYYRLYQAPPAGEEYKYPESTYGVTSWWDYGYWITRIAHRLPSTNNSQPPEPTGQVAELFLSGEEAVTDGIMAELDSSYVIIDITMVTSKFYAMATWAEREQTDFAEIYYLKDKEGNLRPTRLYYPEYYRSLCARLYNFNGQAVTDVNPIVIAYEEEVDREGNRYKRITDAQEFPAYTEALAYVLSQGPSNHHRIVGADRFISPVPLEAVPNFRPVYSSESVESLPAGGTIPEVKIFEYVR